jgi:TonB family protein
LVSNYRYMRLWEITLSLLVVATVPVVLAQQKANPEQKYDAKLCRLKVVSNGRTIRQKSIHVHKGEKATRYSPIIAFEILESGAVVNARITRSSGFSDIDAYALNWIQSTRYNNRSGCGVVETSASVSVDF